MATDQQSSLEGHTFKRLKNLYILALSFIAVSIVVSQLLIHFFLKNQESDSTIVNVAGRQRMLSQRLSKQVLLLSQAQNTTNRNQITQDISETIDLWYQNQQYLIHGNESLGLPGDNPKEIQDMFVELEPIMNRMKTAGEQLVAETTKNPMVSSEVLQPQIQEVLANEADFLNGMDAIVYRFEQETYRKLKRIEKLEIGITVFALLVLFLEFVFIFFPTAKAVRETILQLVVSEKKAKTMAYHADKLREEKDQSVKDLRILNQSMNRAVLFARVAQTGEIIQLGDKFIRFLKLGKRLDFGTFQELISVKDSERKRMEQLLQQFSRVNWQGEVKATTADGDDIWMEMSLLPYSTANNTWETLIIAIDITSRKEAQLEIERLTEKQFEEKMNQQKLISSKIIENQEKEQNRIAKDIHDGIGQMLTALSLNLESIDVTKQEKAALKIQDLKALIGSIIKGVRTATFNLMPPELSDHGIVPALNKLTEELSKLTGKTIFLYDKTDFHQRLESLKEINIYRITQEAINNAIKYADSKQIIVSVSHSDDLLSINIDDNGKGFEVDKQRPANGEGGMGISYMKERINYIDGRLFIHSEKGKGTRVTLNVPLN